MREFVVMAFISSLSSLQCVFLNTLAGQSAFGAVEDETVALVDLFCTPDKMVLLSAVQPVGNGQVMRADRLFRWVQYAAPIVIQLSGTSESLLLTVTSHPPNQHVVCLSNKESLLRVRVWLAGLCAQVRPGLQKLSLLDWWRGVQPKLKTV